MLTLLDTEHKIKVFKMPKEIEKGIENVNKKKAIQKVLGKSGGGEEQNF